MQTLSAAYVAGLIDGDGCIAVMATTVGRGPENRYYSACVTVGMSLKALPILRNLRRQYGGSLRMNRAATATQCEMHRWRVGGSAAASLLEEIQPFLQLKQGQAALALRLELEVKGALEKTSDGRNMWTSHVREHCETIHRRIKELNAVGPEKEIPVTPPGHVLIAQLVAGQWVTFQQDSFSDTGWAPFNQTWPSSGTMRSGRLYLPPTSEAATFASGPSSSRGAETSLGAGALLPTPAQGNFNDGESRESWDQRRKRNQAKGYNGNGMGKPLAIAVREVAGEDSDAQPARLIPTPQAADGGLSRNATGGGGGGGFGLRDFVRALPEELLPTPRAIDGRPKSNGPRPDTVTGMFLYDETGRRRASGERVELLKTPTSQLAVNGGSQHPHKRRGGGHGPTLADQAEHELGEILLPTPTARPKGGRNSRHGDSSRGNDLPEAVHYLPTPRAQERQQSNSRDAGVALSQWVLDETGLLPTPGASDGGGGPRQVPAERTHRGEDHGPRLRDVVPTLQPATPALVDWGKYARAIVRWEQATGRLVPHPLEPGKRGKGRLSPAFVEWMMGLTPGWVTQVPGLSRNAQLKILGNGVVPQQAYYAQQLLLGRAGDLVAAALRAAVEAS